MNEALDEVFDYLRLKNVLKIRTFEDLFDFIHSPEIQYDGVYMVWTPLSDLENIKDASATFLRRGGLLILENLNDYEDIEEDGVFGEPYPLHIEDFGNLTLFKKL